MSEIRPEVVIVDECPGIRVQRRGSRIKFLLLQLDGERIMLIGQVLSHAHLVIPRSDFPNDAKYFVNEARGVRQHPLAQHIIAAGDVAVGWDEDNNRPATPYVSAWDSKDFDVWTSEPQRPEIEAVLTSELMAQVLVNQ